MNPDENQPQAEQPNVAPVSSPDMGQPASDAPTAETAPVTSEPAPVTEPAPQAAPAFARPVAAAPQTSGASKGLAITSLVLGIIGFLTAFLGIGILLGLVAVVLGIIALVKHHGGKGMAITGLVLGALTVIFGGFFLLIAMDSYSGIQQKARDAQQHALQSEQQKHDAMCAAQESGGGPVDATCTGN